MCTLAAPKKKKPDSRVRGRRQNSIGEYFVISLVSCVFGIKSNKSDNALEHAMNVGNLQTMFFRTSV